MLARFVAVVRDPRAITLRGFLLAAVLTALALLVRIGLAPWVVGLQFVTFFPAVVLTALLAGIWAGLAAVALSALCWLFFLAPSDPLQGSATAEMVATGIFVVTGTMLSLAVGALHVALAHMRDLRASLETRVRQRTEQLESSTSKLQLLTSDLERLVEDRTRELLKSQGMLSFVLESLPDGVFLKVREGDELRFSYVNSEGERILGKDRDQVIGKVDRDVIETVHYVEDREVLASGKPLKIPERRLETVNGTRRFEVGKYPLELPGDRQAGLLTILRDKTSEFQREDALRQAQRMEAIGNLTGGIAHDFNNLLAIITGNAELLQQHVTSGSEAASLNEEVLEAALHGADLVRRLLAFARKQHLQPQVVILNERLERTVTLLRRALQEDIDIKVIGAGDLWKAYVDPTQIDDALMNLALNARDAMPNGGTITIETGNIVLDQDYAEQNKEVKPGQYVMLAVSDTGSGMSEDVVQRAFDPFFTTKQSGKGTGLGLSQIYGWIKQSEGHVKIYSELGHGTTIRLYLPRAGESTKAITDAAPTDRWMARDGEGETILIVEDNPGVRATAVRQLTSLGYQTIEAKSGTDALEMIKGGVTFDLLFTDMIMPGGLTGAELARELRMLDPDARILFTSGYTEEAAQGFALNHAILSKPYRKSELARAVREALSDGE